MKVHGLMMVVVCLVLGACDTQDGKPVLQTGGTVAVSPAASAPISVPAAGSAVAPLGASAPLTSPSGVQPPLPAPPLVATMDVGKTSTQSTRALGGGKHQKQ